MIRFRSLVLVMVLFESLPAGIWAADTTHVVVRGDTVFSLSMAHGISQENLMQRNGMTDPSQLRIGMVLSIPAPAAVSVYPEHTVTPGETLFGIARSNGITVAALRSANGFSESRVLRAGEKIRIPVQGAAVTQTAPPATRQAQPQTTIPVLPSAAAPPSTAPLVAQNTVPKRTADASLQWPIVSTEIVYMDGNLGGVLILGREAESVRSISRGTVVYSGPWRGYGNVVIVESEGGFRFLYGANETLSVRVGDKVEAGTEVGRLGIHPSSGKPQLVFIVSRNGVPVDPAAAPRQQQGR